MRQMLLDLSLQRVYNFLIVHFSDACFHSFCCDLFLQTCALSTKCLYDSMILSICKIKPILFYSNGECHASSPRKCAC
jgi:hypothetical protein